ncbi:hypothetical protein [Actinomadura geliboluensis]|uniref:hypothetical protein n=1 Tax=Actinomadura geliboluensis TaxID=882440 RepID=UPI0036B03841
MSTEKLTETSFVIQRRTIDTDWTDEGEESPTSEPLRPRLTALRDAWGHIDDYRVIRIKRKKLDW